ncbi:hypothetical protein LAV73_13050 [Lysinibacillus xylanilyticus]|nr:hypothetical protein [Lysinibacillus xylanilyticus]
MGERRLNASRPNAFVTNILLLPLSLRFRAKKSCRCRFAFAQKKSCRCRFAFAQKKILPLSLRFRAKKILPLRFAFAQKKSCRCASLSRKILIAHYKGSA